MQDDEEETLAREQLYASTDSLPTLTKRKQRKENKNKQRIAKPLARGTKTLIITELRKRKRMHLRFELRKHRSIIGWASVYLSWEHIKHRYHRLDKVSN